MKFTVKDFFRRFPDDDACLQAVMDAQCDDGRMPCVACKRNARWYRLTARKAFTCQFCGHHYYPCAGTIFQDSRTSLQSWLFAMYLFTTTRHGVPAKELQRQLGVTYKTAWRMGMKIRELLAELEPTYLSGHVEIDETLVGGVAEGSGHDGWRAKKTIIMGMMERGGNVITRVIPDTKGSSLLPVIVAKVQHGSRISTDEWKAYQPLGFYGYKHGTVKHRLKEYVRGDDHVNSIEALWARLKVSIRGTHVHVSSKWMHRYVAEFTTRFNMRKRPNEMFARLFAAVAGAR